MKKQIRLLLVNTVNTRQNGQTTFLMNYLRNMDISDMKVGFVAARGLDDWMRGEMETMGVSVHHLPMRNRHPQKYVNALMNIICEGEYNVIHVHGNSATMAAEMFAAERAGVPVRIVHSHNTRCANVLIHKLLLPLMRKCVNARFACGKEAGEWLYGGQKFEVIRNASDARRFAFDPNVRANVRAQLGLSDATVIGAVGSLSPQKNPLFLLEAFAAARKINDKLHLLMLGDGSLRAQVEEKIAQLGLTAHVTLAGRVNDVPDKLQAMDMAVLPSLYEGFPCVLVEWQLNGLPVKVSDTVTRECDMTGLLEYLPLDADQWANAMAKAVPQDERGAVCAEAAAKVALAGYEIRSEAGRLKARYAALLEENEK